MSISQMLYFLKQNWNFFYGDHFLANSVEPDEMPHLDLYQSINFIITSKGERLIVKIGEKWERFLCGCSVFSQFVNCSA